MDKKQTPSFQQTFDFNLQNSEIARNNLIITCSVHTILRNLSKGGLKYSVLQ